MRTTPSVPTRVAHAGDGAHRYFGYDLFAELLEKETFASLMALSIIGRRLTHEETELLDCLSVVMSVADPRIWPLKINRLIGAYGGTLAAFCSTQMCVEGDLIGMWPAGHAAQFLVELRAGLPQADECCDADLEAFLATRKRLIGYGVAFRERDERLDALRECLQRRGRTNLPFWQLQERVSEVVSRTRKIGPNIVIGAAAMLLDLGFDAHEASAISHFFNLNVHVANAVEGAAQAPAILRRLPDHSINYIGTPPRMSPRAERTKP
jgi:hypothetical protein